MSRHESLAVVLRRWPYSENSLVCHLLTPGSGVVAVLAKGVHKLTSGRSGVLDTHALIRVGWSSSPERELAALTDAELLDRFSGISRRLPALDAAALFAELAELAAPPDTPSEEVFLHLVEVLQALDARAPDTHFLIQHLWRACELLGLRPSLDENTPRSPQETRWFAVGAGRLLAPDEARPDGLALRVSPDLLRLLDALAAGSESFPLPPGRVAEDCLTMLGRFLAYHLERPPRAWQAIEERRNTLLTTAR